MTYKRYAKLYSPCFLSKPLLPHAFCQRLSSLTYSHWLNISNMAENKNRSRQTVFRKYWAEILVEQCICANVFKFFNQMSPQYTAEVFHPSSSVHNTRRATQKLDLPFRKSCIGQKTLSYIGPKIWNNLPAQIKLSKSVNTFKHDIKKSFFDDLQKQNDDIFFYY